MPQTYRDLQLEALGNDFDSSAYLGRVKQWLNDGLRDIARRVNVPALEATTTVTVLADTATYAVPVDMLRLLELVDLPRRRILEEVDRAALDMSLDVRGTPTSFALFDNQIVLWPTPDAAATLTLRYQQNPLALSADSSDSTATIPDEYAHMLVCFVRARLFRAEDDFEAANFWKAEYTDLLTRMKADVQRQSVNRVRQIPGRRRFYR